MSGLENLLAGKTLVKRYTIEEVIGRGGFAAVYRAEDLRLGRPVAVKVITLAPPDADARDRLRARFEREARAAAALPHHPNVVTVHDFGTDPEMGLDFLVMELLRGENLAQRFKREGRPPLDLGLQILREAAEGVNVGHVAGIIHRDVKPGNIFLAEPHEAEPFRVCVLDFGIARIATDDQELTRTLGENPLTAAYAAPEQMRGDRDLTPAADVFSLGVVGYQLATGEKPFEPGQGRRGRGREPVRPIRELNPGVSPAVEAVLMRAMAEAPGDRYPTAGAFMEALDAATAEGDRTLIAAAPPPPVVVPDDATVVQPAPAARPAEPAPAYVAAPPPVERAEAGPRVAPVSARRKSKAPAVLMALLLVGLVAAALYAFTRGGSPKAAANDGPVPIDTTPIDPDTTGSTDAAPVTPATAPPAPAPAAGTTEPTATDTGSPSEPAPPSTNVPIQATPGIAPPSAPQVNPAPPSPRPAPTPAPTAPSPRPTPPPPSPTPPAPRPPPPPPSPTPAPPSPQPQPQPQPAPPPAPPPAPAPAPPAPLPPRDTILIPTNPPSPPTPR